MHSIPNFESEEADSLIADPRLADDVDQVLEVGDDLFALNMGHTQLNLQPTSFCAVSASVRPLAAAVCESLLMLIVMVMREWAVFLEHRQG